MMRNSLRTNAKEISQVAAKLPATREGVLLKKGPKTGQGYKPRYFRLCGNLLFYFKQDEKAKDRGPTGEPAGIVILEGCKVEQLKNIHNHPHAFQITFPDDDRDYILAAMSQEELEGWLTVLSEASYEFWRKRMCRLQHKIMLHSGVDPLSERGLNEDMCMEMKSRSERAGAVGTILRSEYQKKKAEGSSSPETHHRFVPSFRGKPRSSSKSAGSAAVLLSTLSNLPTVDICIACTHLPQLQSSSPSAFVEVSVRRSPPEPTDWVEHAETEVIESSKSPNFFTVIAIPADPRLPLDVRFSVLAVQSSSADDQLIITLLGQAECTFEAIVQDINQQVRLPLKNGSLGDIHASEQAFVKASILQADEDDRRASVVTRREPSVRQRSSQVDIRSMKGKLKPHLSKLFQCRFMFPSKSGEQIRVAEEMGECSLGHTVPVNFLEMASSEDKARIDEIYGFGELSPHWQDVTQQLLCNLFKCIGERHHAIQALQANRDCHFKASIHKKTKSQGMEYIPTNLHVQRIKVLDVDGQATTRNVTTVGAFSCHSRGFRQGGLHRIISEHSCPPSFVNDPDTATHTSRLVLLKFTALRSQLAELRSKMFRAAANRSTELFSAALSNLSSKVQQTVADCTKSPINGAIQLLKEARSHQATDSLSADNQSHSPHDWTWNGRSYVTLAKWNLESHMKQIQQQLMSLLTVGHEVEEGISALLLPRNDTGQSQFFDRSPRTGQMSLQRNLSPPGAGHLHRSASQAMRRPPVFCWSYMIIPALQSLFQSLEGLLLIIENSMVFSIVQMDATYQDFDQILMRHDMVIAQALSSLVTAFVTTLWSNISSRPFMRLLQDVGFLAHFESLLSTQGDEKGMLEDMWFAVRQLKNVTLHIVCVDNGDLAEPTMTGTRWDIHVSVPLQESLFTELPSVLRRGDGIRVRAVLFSQGINEAQTLADLNFVSQMSQIQADINQASYPIMAEYVQCYRALCIDIGSAKLAVEASILPGLLEHLEEAVKSTRTKNVDLLQLSEEISHRVFAGRITSCKSAKDRTAMAVTLEQCNILVRDHGLQQKDFQQALDSMRSRGTRLHNCMKNVGHRQYAFNSLQLKCLPAKYCPPAGTYGKRVQG